MWKTHGTREDLITEIIIRLSLLIWTGIEFIYHLRILVRLTVF